MAARLDAQTQDDHGPTETAPSFDHTPTGTPRGVLVFVVQNTAFDDQVTGVTYGGTSLTRVGTYAKVTNETGRVYAYFLGASVPTGTQAVVVNYASPSGGKRARCVTLTGSADLEVVDENGAEGRLTWPQVTLATLSGFDGFVASTIHSGLNAPSSINLGEGGTGATVYTEIGTGRDFGNQSEKAQYWEGALGADVIADYPVGTSDFAMIAVAIAEVAGGTTVFGTVTSPFTVTAESAAVKDAKGASASIYTAGTVTAAKKTAQAVSALPLVVGTTSTGLKVAQASAALPLVVGIASAGSAAVQGSASLALAMDIASAAIKDAKASLALPLSFNAATVGKRGKYGVIDSPFVITIGSAGSTAILGSVTSPFAVSVTTAATKTAQAAVSLAEAVAIATAATKHSKAATIALPLTFLVSSDGTQIVPPPDTSQIDRLMQHEWRRTRRADFGRSGISRFRRRH